MATQVGFDSDAQEKGDLLELNPAFCQAATYQGRRWDATLLRLLETPSQPTSRVRWRKAENYVSDALVEDIHGDLVWTGRDSLWRPAGDLVSSSHAVLRQAVFSQTSNSRQTVVRSLQGSATRHKYNNETAASDDRLVDGPGRGAL